MKNRYTKVNFKKSNRFTRRGAERILNIVRTTALVERRSQFLKFTEYTN
ncbi:MAG: palindromic element RPE5 domain-containing protein [Rickettsia endosymbiont of Ecitomorpha arachnoides]|nr:palindromic element RPE5 domain-containing protein [Rickettsia endosymbiont of Sceptobius lativentris]MCC8461804.1 palindromic element RPE5 domain-containing protein [Rickettsia endosymbiont of Ecitomorpha arachnoides]